MATQSPFVKSNYPRIPGDYYPTIDPRCVYGFLEHYTPGGLVVDPCAPQGSGIVDTLQACGFQAKGLPDAFADFSAEWIVCNPPYSRDLVDLIICQGIRAVELGRVRGAAYLLRSTFDHARGRAEMFESPYYDGQIKLRFRPWWSEDRSKQPIHNFVWHIWRRNFVEPVPSVMYADGIEPWKNS